MDERETLKQMLKLACVRFKQVKVQWQTSVKTGNPQVKFEIITGVKNCFLNFATAYNVVSIYRLF
jgi:hypothetical protein